MVCVESSRRGFPLRPPGSVRCGLRRLLGRLTVVLLTISPSTPICRSSSVRTQLPQAAQPSLLPGQDHSEHNPEACPGTNLPLTAWTAWVTQCLGDTKGPLLSLTYPGTPSLQQPETCRHMCLSER